MILLGHSTIILVSMGEETEQKSMTKKRIRATMKPSPQ
jgi:hypothetical protein